MLCGTIDVQSEVGKGTEVVVRLPLARLPGTATPVSTPSSTTTEGSSDDSMATIRADFQDTNVSLLGFSESNAGPALKECIEDWFGLNIMGESSDYNSADLVIVDEKELPRLQHDTRAKPPAIILCSNASRTNTAARHHIPFLTEFVSKPVGPLKLAKAVRICLERARSQRSGLAPVIAFEDEDSPLESDAGTALPELESLTLEKEGLDPIQVQTNGIVTASDSENARMAIDNSCSNAASEVTVTEEQAFPFPSQDSVEGDDRSEGPLSPADRPRTEIARSKHDMTRRESRRPALLSRATEPSIRSAFSYSWNLSETTVFPVNPPNEFEPAQRAVPLENETAMSLTASNIALHNGETPKAEANEPPRHIEQEKRPPRLLLVDDNKINLRLLETYMRKRKYQYVDSAENGQLAVQAAEVHQHGYDIIFMGEHPYPSFLSHKKSSQISNPSNPSTPPPSPSPLPSSPIPSSPLSFPHLLTQPPDISMPVLNGFEATRAIRDIEDARAHNSDEPKPSPALIIALTGLASSRDQTEAFTSGVDLFMTKPVSFKEVGRLLDNWEEHGGVKAGEGDGSGGS